MTNLIISITTESLPAGSVNPNPNNGCDHDTEFTCVSGTFDVKCVPLSQVCDFIHQCPDGSDEKICGENLLILSIAL